MAEDVKESADDKALHDAVTNVGRKIIPGDEVKVGEYGGLMLKCFHEATRICEEAEVLKPALTGDELKYPRRGELKCQIALALFNRSTREMPEQGIIFSKALEYLTMLMKDKQAETERMAKLRENVPYSPSVYGPVMASVSECKHPGLRVLYDYTRAFQNDKSMRGVVDKIIKSMIVKSLAPYGLKVDLDMLGCPQCQALVPLEQFSSGKLWENEEAEEKSER